MHQLELKYGCNPNQKPARIFSESPLPVEVLNGKPGYINFLDALNSWQLVQELQNTTGLPAAASFKHVSPAGAALGLPLGPALLAACNIPEDFPLSPLAMAYARARGADRMSSFGDWAALSQPCDEATAQLLAKEVSDGIIAPGFTPEALSILRKKRNGNYNVVQVDPGWQPPSLERKEVFGLCFEQGRNTADITPALLQNRPTANKTLSEGQIQDLLVALITLKYTQSNSVCYVKEGQAIGVGAGQQSRIHCTRLAGNKADIWHLRQHPSVLSLPFLSSVGRTDRDNAIDQFLGEQADCEALLAPGHWQNLFSVRPSPLSAAQRRDYLSALSGVALGSDAFFPFGDNIDRAHRSGVDCIAQPGGSIRDDHVIEKCDEYGIAMAFTGLRLFFH